MEIVAFKDGSFGVRRTIGKDKWEYNSRLAPSLWFAEIGQIVEYCKFRKRDTAELRMSELTDFGSPVK